MSGREAAFPVPGAAPATSVAWRLEWTLAREKVPAGEPWVAAVSLRNTSAGPLTVPDLLSPDYGFLRVSVTPPGGKAPVVWRPAVRREARGKADRRLEPGEALAAWVPLYADASGWLLRQPGRHELRAEYAVEGATVSTPPAFLTLLPASEPEAAALLQDPAATRLLLTGHDPEGRGTAVLERLLRAHPRGALAAYARLALGLGRTRERFDAVSKGFRKADCPGALELLKPAVEQLPDPFLAALGARALAGCLTALDRPREALGVFEGYARAHPGGRRLPGVAEVLAGGR